MESGRGLRQDERGEQELPHMAEASGYEHRPTASLTTTWHTHAHACKAQAQILWGHPNHATDADACEDDRTQLCGAAWQLYGAGLARTKSTPMVLMWLSV